MNCKFVRKNVKRRKIQHMVNTCFVTENNFHPHDGLDDYDYINNLPDSLLLEIFSKLKFRELGLCSMVCKKWNRVAKDGSLKKVVIYKNRFENVPPFLKNRFSCYTKEFKLEGQLAVFSKNTLLDKEFVFEMSKRSPNLKKIDLHHCKLTEISIQDLPVSLKHLSLQDCPLFIRTMFSSKPSQSVPQLSCLEIRMSILEGEVDLTLFEFGVFKSLKVLNLSYNNGLGDQCIKSLIKILPQLEILNVEGTSITNESVHLILTNCVNIRQLLIGSCPKIDDNALNIPLRGKNSCLSYLCVRSTFITLNQLHVFLSTCPKKSHVKVEFFEECFGCSEDILYSEFDVSDIINHINFDHQLSHVC